VRLRRLILAAMVVTAAFFGALGATASQPKNTRAEEVLSSWYGLVLELVRHTPTYTPPVASRSLAYLGVTAFEAVATGSAELQSLAGQLNGLKPLPQREAGKIYNEAIVVQAALAFSAQNFFNNTGPTGQRAMTALEAKLHAKVLEGIPSDVVTRSETYGKAVAEHVLAWSQDDGGAVIENMGFPLQYELTKGPAHWVPTNLIAQQQKPLLPNWGKNRTFAMPSSAECALPPPVEYSEDKTSEFYKQALEVFEAKKNLTPDQAAIARFWSDDAMLTPTPPGHWISIALQIFKHDNVDLEKRVDVLARLGVAQADAFIGCWNGKFQYDVLRPITYIRRTMDPKWESLLNTPPFPEYPSGHSTQSGAAATVMTQMFGDNFAFEDATRKSDGVKPRAFPNFWAAANEAGISRLYGGIHYRAAIERGLEQGRCIGTFTNALRTRK
jgi:PAP2 superfamily